jgi:hypothetical protein
MLLIAFRHDLRASKLVDLRWEQIDVDTAILHARGVKQLGMAVLTRPNHMIGNRNGR